MDLFISSPIYYVIKLFRTPSLDCVRRSVIDPYPESRIYGGMSMTIHNAETPCLGLLLDKCTYTETKQYTSKQMSEAVTLPIYTEEVPGSNLAQAADYFLRTESQFRPRSLQCACVQFNYIPVPVCL
jgi:hypothetical protein